ncbi:hypothetical protein [Streptomyces sp. H51]|uniref:hypothetical protein n=1 Tax=Streptomyces sp. H51 TaxID=3111770 RepID=UPI002D76FAAF|nr:hypothetical protein [Streptomyces sp. H51]
MNRSGRLLSVLYLATSGGLAWTTLLEFRHGPLWAGFLFAAASLVPVIGAVRESVVTDLCRAAAEPVGPGGPPGHGGPGGSGGSGGPGADAIVREELDGACCERWWTSLGSDHDATCRHRVPRGSAA